MQELFSVGYISAIKRRKFSPSRDTSCQQVNIQAHFHAHWRNTLRDIQRYDNKRIIADMYAKLSWHRIDGFKDMCGLMDRIDPYVSLELGKEKLTTSVKDNVRTHRVSSFTSIISLLLQF